MKRKPARARPKQQPERPKLTGPIHSRIAELRGGLGLTLEQVAEACDVSKGAVWHWENNDSLPDVDRLPSLARVLKTDVVSLTEGEKSFEALARMFEAKAS